MDCMEILYETKDLLCEELDKINKKHDIGNMGELEVIYKAVDIIKDISTIEAMENAAEDEWDEEASYAGGGGYSGRRGYSRAGRSGRGSYEGGYSGRRGGRYSRAGRSNRGSYEGGGYSGRMSYDDEEMSKEHMMQKIDDMQRQLQQM